MLAGFWIDGVSQQDAQVTVGRRRDEHHRAWFPPHQISICVTGIAWEQSIRTIRAMAARVIISTKNGVRSAAHARQAKRKTVRDSTNRQRRIRSSQALLTEHIVTKAFRSGARPTACRCFRAVGKRLVRVAEGDARRGRADRHRKPTGPTTSGSWGIALPPPRLICDSSSCDASAFERSMERAVTAGNEASSTRDRSRSRDMSRGGARHRSQDETAPDTEGEYESPERRQKGGCAR